jgi:hypothetical protein
VVRHGWCRWVYTGNDTVRVRVADQSEDPTYTIEYQRAIYWLGWDSGIGIWRHNLLAQYEGPWTVRSTVQNSTAPHLMILITSDRPSVDFSSSPARCLLRTVQYSRVGYETRASHR